MYTRECLKFGCSFVVLFTSVAAAAPPGFVKTTFPLAAPPAALAFDDAGVLWALEGAAFGSNMATMRSIQPNGTFGSSFPLVGDDPMNFFVGGMAYDALRDRLLVTDNTADGRLYAVDKTGMQQVLATGIAGIAGVAVRDSGEIFVSTAPFGSAGAVLVVDRTGGSAIPVLDGLGYGAGLAFDAAGDLIVQDADATTFRGRLQRLPIDDSPSGLQIGRPVPLVNDMQAAAGVTVDVEGHIFTTGSGGLYRVSGTPVAETLFDANGNAAQFATAIAFDPGPLPFAPFAGPGGGRLAYMADFGFAVQDSFVTVLTPAAPGDYSADGRVDHNDYGVWRSAFGSTMLLAADSNGDSVVDAADYVAWRANAGANSSALGQSTQLNVPEPVTFVMVIAPLSFLAFRRHVPSRQH